MIDRPLQIISACRLCDLPVLEITARQLPKCVPFRSLSVVCPDKDFAKIRSRLSPDVRVIPENNFLPGMTIEALRALPVRGFPRAAGWYFQQLLKLQFAFTDLDEDYFLIWDADTVPLRPMRFFDAQGRMLLTKATEHHAPYFETYRNLFGEDARREFSFISQHIVVEKSMAREMLTRIERHVPGEGNWAWKIMRSLPQTGDNLFSEYETYGHFAKNHFAERVAFVQRAWQRRITHYTGRGIPTERELATLREEYEYAAFERVQTGWRRMVKAIVGRFYKRQAVRGLNAPRSSAL